LSQKRAYRRLYERYRFDQWHAAAPYWCRRYKREAVRMANALAPSVVVEIGCGLGEVIRRIQAPWRYGVDRDPHVLEAAGRLTREVNFVHGTFDELRGLHRGGVIDVLVVLNWLDGLSVEAVRQLFLPHLHRVGHLLLDEVVRPEANQIGHEFAAMFEGRARLVDSCSRDGDHRLVLLRVLPTAGTRSDDERYGV
jgi:SAM-dependent methyltransferase